MRHRFTKLVLGAALFMLLAGTATVAATSHTRRPRTRSASSTRGPAPSRPTAPSTIQGFKPGLEYATKGTSKVNGKTIEITVRRRRGRPRQGGLRGQGPDRPGLQDHRRAPTSSGVALQVAPLAAQNQVLFISGPAATDAITGINKYTFRSGRQSYQDVLAAKSFLGEARQEGRRLRAGLGVRPGQRRGREGGHRRQGPQRVRDPRAADGDRLHAVRAAGRSTRSPTCSSSPGPAPPRPRCGRRSSSRASSPRRRSSPARRAGDLADLRRRRRRRSVPLALLLRTRRRTR